MTEFKCDAHGVTWGGNNTCHCESCGLLFSGVTGFDEHRKSGGCLTRRQLRARGYREVRPGILGLPAPAEGGGNA